MSILAHGASSVRACAAGALQAVFGKRTSTSRHMRLGAAFRAVGALCLAGVVSGCSYGLDKRYGLDPVLNANVVQTATDNRVLILNALARDANLSPDSSSYYYKVALAGFNHIDDECRTYFHQIFFLNRDRERIKGGLGAANAATAAILGVTGASVSSMAIVAQAFGLGIAGTDLATGAYLFQLPPSTTQGFVKEMQLAYREGAANRRALIDSAPAAYQAIQGYLELCLPPTIEAKLAEHIASARATADTATRSRSSSFGINLVSAPAVTRDEIRTAARADVDVVVQRPPLRRGGDRPRATPRVTHVEPGIMKGELPRTRDDWAAYRETLCVTDEKELGPKTRQALTLFKAAVNDKLAANLNAEMTKRELELIEEARDKFPNCMRGGSTPPRNAFEVGLYLRAKQDQVNIILRRALALAKRTKPDIYSPGPADSFDTARAVSELRAFHKIDPLPGMQPAELDDRIWSQARKRK